VQGVTARRSGSVPTHDERGAAGAGADALRLAPAAGADEAELRKPDELGTAAEAESEEVGAAPLSLCSRQSSLLIDETATHEAAAEPAPAC
jgi:hypothetical protein